MNTLGFSVLYLMSKTLFWIISIFISALEVECK